MGNSVQQNQASPDLSTVTGNMVVTATPATEGGWLEGIEAFAHTGGTLGVYVGHFAL